MRIINYTLVCFFILFSFVSNGQDKTTDSLKKIIEKHKEDTNNVNALNKLSQLVTQSNNIEDGRYYGDQALLLSKKLKFHRGQANALENMANSWIRQNNLSKVRQYLLEAVTLAEQTNDNVQKAKMLTVVAQTYAMEENYPEALQYYYQSLAESERNKNDFWTGYSLAGAPTLTADLPNFSDIQPVVQISEVM